MYIIHVMNDIYSSSEIKYRPRWLASLLRESIKDHPVIVLSGARQVGKSTLLLNEEPFKNWRYVSLDDFNALYQSRKDPESLWAGADTVILDEVQKSPRLLDAVKSTVDTAKNRCRFILSGSANLLLMEKVSESLAGRAAYFSLLPMTIGELNGNPPTNILRNLFNGNLSDFEKDVSESVMPLEKMWKGFMPTLIPYSENNSVLRWWEGYISTYLERDLRQLSQIDSLPDFRRLMSVLALRCGQMLNQSEVSRDTGITQPTVHRYINLLETTCMLNRLPAFSINRTKRLIKSPKIMWNDPGLVTFLAGHYTMDSLESSREIGGIYETMIYLHLHTLSQLLVPSARLYYWRTSTGKEVDFVVEWGRKLLAIEVKFTSRPKYSDIENIKMFLDEYPETSAGVLFHTGTEVKRLHEKIIALPWYFLG